MVVDTKTTAPARKAKLASLPPREGLQQLYTLLLEQLRQNYPVFITQGGEESLHDFRVSVRRLRSLLRNYRRMLELDALLVEQLRGLQQKTNHARDLEVFVSQLQRHCPEHPQLVILQHQLEDSYQQLRDDLPAQWKAISLRVQQPLSINQTIEKYDTLGEVCGHIAARQLARIKGEFKSLRRHWDEALVHRLRIRGKRMRYLLEPFSATPKVARALKEVRRLQDQLGDYRDQQLLQQRLEALRNEEALRHGYDESISALIVLLNAQQQRLVKEAKRFRKRSRQQRLLHPLDSAIKKLRA